MLDAFFTQITSTADYRATPSRREVTHVIISHNVWYKISGRPTKELCCIVGDVLKSKPTLLGESSNLQYCLNEFVAKYWTGHRYQRENRMT